MFESLFNSTGASTPCLLLNHTSDKTCVPSSTFPCFPSARSYLPYPAHPFPINPHSLTRESVIGTVSYFTWFSSDKIRLLLFAVASHIEL